DTSATDVTLTMCLSPQMKCAYHHLRRIDQFVMHTRTFTGLESACPMSFFQLTSKTRLVPSDASDCEEAILKVTRQKGTVLQVLDRLSLGVQQRLYSLDDFFAMGQEQLEKFDMRVKQHLAKALCRRRLFRCRKRMIRFAHHNTLRIGNHPIRCGKIEQHQTIPSGEPICDLCVIMSPDQLRICRRLMTPKRRRVIEKLT